MHCITRPHCNKNQIKNPAAMLSLDGQVLGTDARGELRRLMTEHRARHGLDPAGNRISQYTLQSVSGPSRIGPLIKILLSRYGITEGSI